jgi:hypothetical protein
LPFPGKIWFADTNQEPEQWASHRRDLLHRKPFQDFRCRRIDVAGILMPDASEQALIASTHALRADDATLRAIQVVPRAQHGMKLSLNALHHVLAEQRGL